MPKHIGTSILVSDEVRDAVDSGAPVVALESTIFTHGLPRPTNYEVAIEGEAILRDVGVVPATIGIIEGVPRVGLTTAEIELLSTSDAVSKVSRRDLPVVAAKRLHGGTTVAATAYLAHAAGVTVFSTGGLGGVHRGAATSFDESADLTTLAGLPIVVISAGVKSILDVPATLERLETLNISVLGYGTTTYPGFYVVDSGSSIEYSVDTPDDVARVVAARDGLGLSSAILVANPIAPDRQLDPELHDRILREAWAAAEADGVAGNATTPYLLDYIQRATRGESLRVNIDVYRGNVRLGGAIAKAL